MLRKQTRTLAIRPAMRKPSRPPPVPLPFVWLVTDAKRLPDPLPSVLRLPRGSGVLLRHYEWPFARRLALARQLRVICRERGLVLLVAGDAHLALACGADGLHLPQGLLAKAVGVKRRYPGWLVTAAAHDAAAIAQAARNNVDAVLISPVFATASHPGATGLGVVRFAALAVAARRWGLGVYALGGVDAASSRRIAHVPKNGTAAIRGMAAV
jgi:Thiamine monophosphate synthase